MSLHHCPECDNEVATNSTTAGAFEAPPTLFCYHVEMENGEETDMAYEMELVSEAGIDTNQEGVVSL